MNAEQQTLTFLSEILGVVIRHDPMTLAKVTARYGMSTPPRQTEAANDDA